jgi:S1-C subfamily serine protease
MNPNIYASVVQITVEAIGQDIYQPFKVDNDYEKTGTGFFIDTSNTTNGNDIKYILTCAHVIDEAVKVWFTVPSLGKQKFPAEIISIYYDADIALLRSTKYTSDTFLQLGDSNTLQPGDEVIALGYPVGSRKLKMTGGIISGYHETLIQTDTAVNPGNSGGPLLKQNMVVGINSSKKTGGHVDNIGYVTPILYFIIIAEKMINITNEITPLIIHKNDVVAEFNSIDDITLKLLNLPPDKTGYLITGIYDNSPFKSTDIRLGDLLCKFDKYDIDNYGECHVEWTNDKIYVTDLLIRYPPGCSVEIIYWSVNNKEFINATITLTQNIPYNIKMYHYPVTEPDYEIISGMVISNLTLNHLLALPNHMMGYNKMLEMIRFKQLKHRFTSKLIISNILAGSYYMEAQPIQIGEFIEKIDNHDVHTLYEFRKLFGIGMIKNKMVKIQTERGAFIIMSLKQMIKDNEFISNKYNIKLSKFHQIIKKKDI